MQTESFCFFLQYIDFFLHFLNFMIHVYDIKIFFRLTFFIHSLKNLIVLFFSKWLNFLSHLPEFFLQKNPIVFFPLDSNYNVTLLIF